MRKLILTCAWCMLLVPTAWAVDIPVRWTGSTDADGYRISQSTDTGATWTQVADVPHNDAVPLDEQSTTILGAPDTGLLLFRVSAYNPVGETVRVEAGAWYNGSWDLPAAPSGMGIP